VVKYIQKEKMWEECVMLMGFYPTMMYIGIAAFVLTAVGFWFAFLQLKKLNINRNEQIENSKRDKTVEVIMYYHENLTKDLRLAENIVADFDEEQCQSLYSQLPIYVDERTMRALCEMCPMDEDCRKEQTGEFRIQGLMLRTLRNNVAKYLSTIESVLLAWQLGTVNRGALEEQLEFLNQKKRRDRALEKYRAVVENGKSYPSIDTYYQYLDKKAEQAAGETLRDII